MQQVVDEVTPKKSLLIGVAAESEEMLARAIECVTKPLTGLLLEGNVMVTLMKGDDIV